MTTNTLRGRHFDMVEECEVHEDKLTAWEREFLDSLTNRLGEGKGLTIKQTAILQRTHNKVTRPDWG